MPTLPLPPTALATSGSFPVGSPVSQADGPCYRPYSVSRPYQLPQSLCGEPSPARAALWRWSLLVRRNPWFITQHLLVVGRAVL